MLADACSGIIKPIISLDAGRFDQLENCTEPFRSCIVWTP